MRAFLLQVWKDKAVKTIFFPFIITRILLVVSGLLTPLIVPFSSSREYEVSSRGWVFTSQRLIDMWARWDSGWYLHVIKNGYSMGESVYVTSNLPFFPVFPLLVRFFTFFVPYRPLTDEIILSVGIVLSNVLFFGALVGIYKLAQYYFSSGTVAKNTIWFLLVFPTSFFLSSFYSESSFLFFTVMSLLAATRKKWWLAALLAGVVSATRLPGVFVGILLLLEYLNQKEWKIQNIDMSILWLVLTPVGVTFFFTFLYVLTGDFFASIKAHGAWGRETADPISSLLFPTASWWYLTPFDQLFALLSVTTSMAMIFNASKKYIALGVFILLMIMPALFTGTLDSVMRFITIMFPFFMYWAFLLKKNVRLNLFLQVVFFSLQLVFFGLFTQFYWMG